MKAWLARTHKGPYCDYLHSQRGLKLNFSEPSLLSQLQSLKVGLKDATLLQLRWGLTTQKTHFNHLQWHGNRSFVAFVSLSFSPPHTACFACWFVWKADVREGILPGSFILGNSAPLEVHLLSKLILSWHSYHCKSSRVFRGCWCTFNRWNRLLSLFVESLNWKYHNIRVWGGALCQSFWRTITTLYLL